jgi:16S rRNA processing protein RimM
VAADDIEKRIAVGKITKAHGIRGEVSVLPLTEVPDRFDPDSVLWLEDGRSLIVDRARRHHGRFIVSFTQVRDRNGADLLHGAYLFVPESELPALPEGSYWPHQIEGCEVFDVDNRSLGTIAEVLHTDANDVWVARTGTGDETLIPALKSYVVSVDVGERRIVTRPVADINEN